MRSRLWPDHRVLLQVSQPLMLFQSGPVSSWAPGGPEPLFLGSVESNKKGRVVMWIQTWVRIPRPQSQSQVPRLQSGLHIFIRRDVRLPTFPHLDSHSATEFLAGARPGV